MWKSEVARKRSRRLWWVVIIKLFRESATWLHNVGWNGSSLQQRVSAFGFATIGVR